jgi:protein O-GlcNAc transferase
MTQEMNVERAVKSALEQLRAGNLPQAETIFKEIVRIQPQNVSALHFIGVIHYQLKDYDSSIEYIKRALELGPDYVDAYNNLGIVLHEVGQLDEAIKCYHKAIELNPNFASAYYNFGITLKEKWQIDDAVMNYRKAIELCPNFAEAYNKLGNALQDQGKLDEAEDCYRHALRIRPDCAPYLDNLLFMMNYDSRHDASAIFAEHYKFARKFETPLASAIVPHKNDCSSSRRLRIGYVSPDFRKHPVACFVEPVLEAHSHEQFEVFCYSDVRMPDHVTKRLQGYVSTWRDITGMPDERVVELIRQDEIDILVDLAGHTANNRLLVFARKPVPIQVSWIGYPNTTGLSAIDYRIVDRYTDPPGLTDRFCTEKLLRMPDSFLCYLPNKDSPAVGDLPALKSGHVTFGSFNYFPKVSRETVAVWTAILKVLPDSRLIMKTRNFADSGARRCAMDMFIRHGIAPERFKLLSMETSFEEHLNTYNRIDIALDTFPYNGTTTTCEALWMGVPVITFGGTVHASRVGMSILTNIGLPELVTRTPDEYLAAAMKLADDLQKLASIREGMRERMELSPLLNVKRFTANLESCYKQMWQKRCMK